MGVKENEAVIRKVYDEMDKGNYDVIDECFADDFVNITYTGDKRDRNSFKEFLKYMSTGFPDIKRTVQDIIVTDNRAALFFTWEATDKWEYKDRTPTGKKIKVREIYFIRFKEGKISEYRQYGDSYGMAYKLDMLDEIKNIND